MPIVPRSDQGQVQENTSSGPLMSTQVDPRAFGAGLAESVQHLGATFQQMGDEFHAEAIRQAGLNAKADADAQSQATGEAQDKLWTDFREKNPGKLASDNLPEFYKSLETTRLQGQQAAAARSPMAGFIFNEDTRLQQTRLMKDAAAWSSDQLKTYNVHQYQSMADSRMRGVTLDTFDAAVASAKPEFHAMAATLGQSGPEADDYFKKWQAVNMTGLLKGLAAKDPAAAGAALDKYSSLFSPAEYGELRNQLQASLDSHNVSRIAAEAASGAPGGSDQAFLAATHHREGTGPNPHSTADGGGQFIEGTWLRLMKQPQFAADVQGKTPTQVLDLRHDPAVYDRAILAYRDENKAQMESRGYDTSPSSLLLAHGYGPAGAEAILSAPPSEKIENIVGADTATKNHVLGQTVQQVVAGVAANFGPTSLDERENALPATLASIADRPELRGDSNLIHATRAQTVQNIQEERTAHTASTQAALSRLEAAGVQAGTSDPAAMPNLYTGAADDYSKLDGHEKLELQRRLMYDGNMPTTERRDNYLKIYGQLLKPETSSQAARMPLTGPLTAHDHDELTKMQAQIRAREDKIQQSQAQIHTILGNRLVGDALRSRPDVVKNPDEYDKFTGELAEKIEQWNADPAHKGKKPTDTDYHEMAAGILAGKPAYYQNFPWIKTTINSPMVPPDEEKRIRSEVEPTAGPGGSPRTLTPYEVGKLYQWKQSYGR